jgi:hypothetical protein
MRAFYAGWRIAGNSDGRLSARAFRGIAGERSDFEIWHTLSAEFPFAKPNTKTRVANGPRKRQTPTAKSPAAPALVADLSIMAAGYDRKVLVRIEVDSDAKRPPADLVARLNAKLAGVSTNLKLE